MTKQTEPRSLKSADNSKSDQNPHLSDEQLLLLLDGELTTQEAAQVELHVQACWSCRARREQIEKAIGNVVEYRDHLVRPSFPIPPARRTVFLTRLEQLAISLGRPPLWKRILSSLRVPEAISEIEVPRYVLVGAIGLVILILFSFTRLWKAPSVSASELLENAQGSEARAIHSVAKPVVYQKLSIRVGSNTVTRTIYRDPVGMRQADRVELVEDPSATPSSSQSLRSLPHGQPIAVSTADAELRRTFVTAHLYWEEPLSPANYSTWHKNLDEKVDEVTTDGNEFITLKTTTSEGPIAEGSITVRTSDFHPIAEDLRLQDGRRVELHELAWEVLPMDAINVAIFETEPTLNEAVIKHPIGVALQPPVATDSELAEAELRVRVAIHAEKADLGEAIELDREGPSLGQRLVIVRGILSTPERKNDLLAALQGIPHVDLRLQTMEEAQTQQDHVPTDKLQGAASQASQAPRAQEYGIAGGSIEGDGRDTQMLVITGWPAFEKRLEEHFPIAQDRTTFVNETVEIVQDAMAQAWALRRLTNRYETDRVAELSSGSRQTLELLIRDHVSVLRRDVDEVRVRVSPLLSPTIITAAPPSVSDTTVEHDWRDSVVTVFSEMQKVNDDGGALLAGSSETIPDLPTAVRELQQAFAELETQLPSLYQQVSGPFLDEPKR
jgi:hypothetical protein